VTAPPFTDPRRARALRSALAEMAPWLAPEWAGLDQEGDFGAGLYEIAARLAEHSTRRLDQTALRDQLAFLDTLDIAAPAPKSATVPIVFMLAEKRTEPVYAPPRVQIAAAGADGPVTFETQEGLALTPARLLRLVTADPASDRIELAPSQAIGAPARAPATIAYRLVSAAGLGGTMLQLAQAVGLAPGDLLRIGGIAYRIARKAAEIITLLDPLEAAVPAGAAAEKVTRLDAFTLRNLSEHIVYVGHKELLKLDGPATIALHLDPPGLARRLAALDVGFHLWGKPKEADAADWQPLRLLGGRDGDLRLRKDWEGAVEEVEAEGRKSRWIRLRLQTPIADAAPPDTRAAAIAIKVSSNAAAVQTAEGSRSIVSAFYNGLPLPLTTAFLPFGPEPQRFDTFALAAPEALSKKGAAVELAVTLSDASLGAMATVIRAPTRAYGIGRNGRLQALRIDAAGTLGWRQLDRPPPASTGGGAAPRLDPAAGLHAFELQAGPPASDVIAARDESGRLWLASAKSDLRTWSVQQWTALTPPGDPTVDSFCLAIAFPTSPTAWMPRPGTFPPEWIEVAGPPLPPLTRLIAADAQGLHARIIDSTGAAQEWQKLAPSPASPVPKAPLRLARVAGGDGLIAAIDAAGAVYRGTIADAALEWKRLAPDGSADASVPPDAVLQDKVTHVVIAAPPGGPAIAMLREGDTTLHPPAEAADAAGKPVAISCLAAAEGSRYPLVAVLGGSGVLLWSGETQATSAALPPDGDATKFSVLLTAASPDAPRLILGSPEERLLHAAVESGERRLAYAPFDLLRLPSALAPAYWWVEGEAAPTPLQGGLLKVGTAYVLALAPGRLSSGERYYILSPVAGAQGTGKRVSGKPRQLRLDTADAATAEGDLLEIGSTLFEIDKVEENGSRVATLLADVPAGALDYIAYRKGVRRQFGKADQGTLLNFGAATLPEDLARLDFEAPAAPAQQACILASVQPAGEAWAKLQSGWTTAPVQAEASFAVARTLGSWAAVPLPRSSENPDLSWEYFDGRGWRRLDRKFSDGTANLASSGPVRFTVPDDLSQTDVAGKKDYWIRARLVGGDYGRPSYIVDTSGNRQSIVVDRSTLNPPEIFSIEAKYALEAYIGPQAVLAVNNLAAIDQSQAAAEGGATFELFEGLAAHMKDPAGLGRSLNFCLSRAPDVAALSLYADAADVGAAGRRLQAEVLRPEGWVPVVCDDGTAGLARPGLIRLFLSPAPTQLPLFGCDGWWLRLRPLEPSNSWSPVVRGLYLNAVTAEQAKTLRQAILGASLGAPGQTYRLAEAPVLPETLELRVRESLSDEEKAALSAVDPEAVASYPFVEGEWIRWRAVDSFVDQGGGARVFRLDPSSGEIRFGNGRDGRIPPAGRDAIRAVGYQAGGGNRGNLPAFAVGQLKTTLESVELAVNPVDAGGGADPPPNERLAQTAPARLRHAGRALAPSDIEALATGSSPDVVRARCLRGRGCGIDLVVAIRETGERCPIPSRARREGIARNIAAAGWGALAPEDVRVLPPVYVPVSIDAVVIARSAERVAEVENGVRGAIVRFLHPMDGGEGGLGWPFGRRPWPSDIQRVAAAVAGVDRVVDVVAAREPGADLGRLGSDALICAEEDAVRLVVQPPRSAR
jgi:hypothetical protein